MQPKTLLTATLATIPALCAPHRATGEIPDRTTLAAALETSSAAPVPSGWHVATVLLPDAASAPSAAPNAEVGESKFYLSTLHTSNKLAKQKCPIGKHHEPVDCISKRVRDLLKKFFEEPVVEERVGDFDHGQGKRQVEGGGERGENEDEDEKLVKAQEELADALFDGYKTLPPGAVAYRRDLQGEKEGGDGESAGKWKPWGEPVEPDVHYFDSDMDDGQKGEEDEEAEGRFDPWSPILPPRPVLPPPRPHPHNDPDGQNSASDQWHHRQVGDAALWTPENMDALQHELDLGNGKSSLTPRDETASLLPLDKDTAHKPPVDTGKYGPFTGDIYWAITNETAWETFGEESHHSKSTERKIAILTSKISKYIASNSASETCIAMVKNGEQFARVVVTFGKCARPFPLPLKTKTWEGFSREVVSWMLTDVFPIGMRGEHIKYDSSEDVRAKLARCEVEETKKYGDGFEGFEV